jgi:transcription elongation GreA/GreB family factor
MGGELPEKPPAPDLPKYLREPLEKQSPERLETVAAYANELAEWKRRQRQQELEDRRAEEEVDEEELEELEERGISTDPADYEDVPASGAYITIKTTKQTAEKSYRYLYWQWREGDSWKNEYIAPVNPQE